MKYWMCNYCHRYSYAEPDSVCLLCATTAPDYCHIDGGDDCEWREINAREFLTAVSKELPEPEKNLHYNETLQANNETSQDKQLQELPFWCKVGRWVYHDSDGYYYKIKSIDKVNNEIQITDSKNEYAYTANKIGSLFSPAHLRPYNAEEMKALVGKVVETPDGEVNLITAFSKETNLTKPVVMTVCWIDADYMLKNGFTIDGHLCGVLEHLNDKGEWVE